jgi:hypothetical protein
MADAINSLASKLANQANASANTGVPAQLVAAGGGAGLLAVAIIGALIVVGLRARKANQRRRTAGRQAAQNAPSESPQTSGDEPTETIPNQ